jgi:hypothetical protein
LDDKRLNNQPNEVCIILKTLCTSATGWQNHPAVLQWKGYEDSLVLYGLAIENERIKRGMNPHKSADVFRNFKLDKRKVKQPPWLGDKKFHLSHQSNLLRKNSDWYKDIFGYIPNNLPYYWPVRKGN